MSKTLFQDQELTHKIIAAAIEVHRRLGPGLLEAVYRFCLCYELENIGLKYKQEVTVPIIYRDKKQVGLLINFNEPVLTKGVRRCVLGAKDNLSASGQGPVPAFSG